LLETIDAVAEVIDSVGPPIPLLGYSQGGRIALLVALDHPQSISRLVLISATAGIEATSERSGRAEADRELAARIASMTLNAFLDEWTTSTVAAVTYPSAAEAQADRSVRAENTPEGLSHALIALGQGAQPAVWDRLASLSMPVLVVHGERDTKYAGIANRMARSIPDCTVVSIEQAGHNPLIENPDATHTAISRFLDRAS
jgi:2-succinyl-6-hydroxy-2,4-cyclohexadiene-1-carboxylate synthase